jgi:hypothetical protein
VPVPDWCFTASCDHHDFNYALGGLEEGRERADDQFLAAMLADSTRARWHLRAWYRFWARTYYRAVRRFARPYFRYRDREPTLADLLAEAEGRRRA